MKHPLYYIADRLIQCAFSPVIALPEHNVIAQAQFLPSDVSLYQDRVLYYADLTNPQVSIPAQLPCNLIYFSTDPIPDIADAPCNSLRITTPISLEVLSAAVNEVDDALRRSAALIQAVLNVSDNSTALQDTADLCYNFWESLVTIYDSGFRLLAKPTQYQPKTKEQKNVSDIGYLTSQYISDFRRSKRLDVYYSSAQPYKITSKEELPGSLFKEDGAVGYIDVPIRTKGKSIGFLILAALKNRPGLIDADCLLDISRILSIVFQRSGAYLQGVANPYENILLDVFMHRITNDKLIFDRFRELGRPLKPCLFALSAQLTAEQQTKPTKVEELQVTLRELFPNSSSTFYNGYIILLLSRAIDACPVDPNDSRILNYLKLNELRIGISNMFRSPSQLEHHVLQANRAAFYGRHLDPGEYVYRYSDYLAMNLLDSASKTIRLHDFCHPTVLSLFSSGRSSDLELLRTIYYYLHYAKDAVKACAALHIQRSTLFYRVNKFKQLIGEDIDAGDVLFRLLLSFEALRYEAKFSADSAASSLFD